MGHHQYLQLACNKMKNKNDHTIGTIPISNPSIVEIVKSIPLIHDIQEYLLSCLGIYTFNQK